MSFDASSIITIFSTGWNAFQSSAIFSVLQVFLGVYSIVLLIDIILLLYLRDIPADLKQTLYGNTKQPLVSRSKTSKRWEGIVARLRSNNPSQYKAAVLEADALASEMLHNIGYEGKNMKERLDAVRDGEIATINNLRAAHTVRNRIIQDPDFSLEKEEAEGILKQYESFFTELELF